MSRRVSEYHVRLRPISPGAGFRFVAVGKLIRQDDEYFDQHGRWKKSENVRGVVSVTARNLYRRRIR